MENCRPACQSLAASRCSRWGGNDDEESKEKIRIRNNGPMWDSIASGRWNRKRGGGWEGIGERGSVRELKMFEVLRPVKDMLGGI